MNNQILILANADRRLYYDSVHRFFVYKNLSEDFIGHYKIHRMLPIKKRAWCEALRSGKYVQGIGRLIDVDLDTFCCMGVKCDLSKSDYGISLFFTEGGGYRYKGGGIGTGTPPMAFWRSLFVDEVVDTALFALLNDDFKLSFYGIADIIEEYL